MHKEEKILFIYKNPSSFVLKDRDIFAKHFTVAEFSFNPAHKILTPFEIIRELWFLLLHLSNTKAVVCEFADYHTFFPLLFAKLFKIPSFIIICGTEGHCFPSIGYGNHNKKLMAWFTCKSLKLATHLLPVHRSLVISNYTYHDNDFPQQGYQAHCKNVNTPFTEINYGYDGNLFYNNVSQGANKIPNSFLTVALNVKGSTFYRKGVDLILEMAKSFPDYTFTILGAGDSLDHLSVPANVLLLPPFPYETLITHFSYHEFYFQLSIAEGFPNALCEAMLCECIPIGSAVNAIPDIIGNTGFILQRKDVTLLKELVGTAVKSDKAALAKKARQRIVDNFPLEKREKELVSEIEKRIIN